MNTVKTRRIFVSMPADNWQTPAERDLKWGIVKRIEQLGYVAEIFTDPRGVVSISASQSWSRERCEAAMRRCDGCAVLGFARTRLTEGEREVALPTEYNHYEGAMAQMLGLPMVTWLQDGAVPRVIFSQAQEDYMRPIPAQPTPAWFRTKDFTVPFGYFQQKLAQRRDVFLGYCSASSVVARKLKSHLQRSLGLTVLDWAVDFDPARPILHQIERAAGRCGAGIFLFTKDDPLVQKSKAAAAGKARYVPRDNVVFEAGFFCAAKGKQRTLIVLQKGAKMPADLGGDIYAPLPAGDSIDDIKPVLRQFAASL